MLFLSEAGTATRGVLASFIDDNGTIAMTYDDGIMMVQQQ